MSIREESKSKASTPPARSGIFFFDHVTLARRQEKILLKPVLPRVEVVVPPAQRIKAGMRPALDDQAALNHQDLLRPPDRRQTVRDHKRRPPLHQVTQPVLDHRLRF